MSPLGSWRSVAVASRRASWCSLSPVGSPWVLSFSVSTSAAGSEASGGAEGATESLETKLAVTLARMEEALKYQGPVARLEERQNNQERHYDEIMATLRNLAAGSTVYQQAQSNRLDVVDHKLDRLEAGSSVYQQAEKERLGTFEKATSAKLDAVDKRLDTLDADVRKLSDWRTMGVGISAFVTATVGIAYTLSRMAGSG